MNCTTVMEYKIMSKDITSEATAGSIGHVKLCCKLFN